jgi:hypothetical protein
MVGQNTLKTYDFQGIEEYFDMIVESYFNGQLKQCRAQIRLLSLKQKISFRDYIKETSLIESDVKAISKIVTEVVYE